MINNVAIMGRITHELELKGTKSGKNYLKFSIAVPRSFSKNKEVDFIFCQAWEKTAEFIYKYFSKGSLIAMCGSLQTDNYEDKNGNKRKSTTVVINQISFCGENKNNQTIKKTKKPEENNIFDDDDNDIPF